MTEQAKVPNYGDRAASDAVWQELDELRQKLRMIVSHATGGHTSDIDQSVNDICVEISRSKNLVFAHGKEVGERDALLTRPVVSEEAIRRAEQWLRECSTWMLSNDLDMGCPMETDPLDIADDLRALTRSPAVDGWMPIETLEISEGAVVLVALSSTAANETYGEGGKRTVHIATFEDDCWSDSYSAYRLENRQWRVTHWQPLPEPPSPSEGQDEQ